MLTYRLVSEYLVESGPESAFKELINTVSSERDY